MTRAGRRLNGEGSVTRRADGRWMGRFYAWTSTGTRKRITVYGRTRKEATEKMREAQEHNRQGIPVPDTAWKLGDWLDHWLEHVVSLNRRPATYRLYEMTVRLYLKPGLGSSALTRLSASGVQAFFNGQLAAGRSIRTVQVMKTVLSSALSRAMREELATWSTRISLPSGFNTRVISSSAASMLGIAHNPKVQTTVSKVASVNRRS